VIANGKLHDPIVAEQVLKSQEGDFCSVGKGALADPQWPNKVIQGEAPTPFMFEMVSPYATLDNYYNWSSQHIPPR
jgi:2,4-dienoyl-CoA reductase-like NADH-dependent reductase (Old Yellow Enzyme family)